MLFNVLVAVGAAATAISGPGQAALEVPPGYIVFGTALFIGNILEVYFLSLPRGSLHAPEGWRRRGVMVLTQAVYCALFAAPSMNPASPTWVFVVMFGSVIGVRALRLGAEFFATFVVAVLGTTLLTAPAWSAKALGTATYVALLCCAALHLGFRFGEARRRVLANVTTARSAAEAARAEAARLAVAMSVHDGLSGAVFVARGRAEVAPEQQPLISTALASHARGVLEQHRKPTLEAALRALPGATSLTLSLPTQWTGLDEVELEDLRAVAMELTANALRHRDHQQLRVLVELTPLRLVEVTAEGPRRIGESGGHGSRNVALRVASWGGRASLDDRDESSVARASWAPVKPDNLTWQALSLPLATLGFVPVSLVTGASFAALAFTVGCVLLGTVGSMLSARELARLDVQVKSFHEERQRAVHAAEAELTALAAAVTALEQSGDVAAFSQRVTHALHALENGARA